MQKDKVASFRAPDQEFVDMFNDGMAVTGLDIANLAVRAIRKGLRDAVLEVAKQREDARKAWNQQYEGPPSGRKR